LVRVPLHQLTVFKGAGLTLVRVAAQIARAGMILGNERPFDAGRKARPSPAAESRALHQIGDIPRRHLAENLSDRLVSSCALVIRKGAGIAGLRHILEQDQFVRHDDSEDLLDGSGNMNGPDARSLLPSRLRSSRMRLTLACVSRS